VKRIVVDLERCMGCRACNVACALAHSEAEDLVEAIRSGARPRMYLVAAAGYAVPLQCRHCDDAPCERVCPSGAISREKEGAPVLADPEKCIGCGFCMQVCPFGIIRVLPEGGRVIKCDLCVSRQAEGLEPACVAACPVGALSFEEAEDDSRRKRARIAAEMVGGRG
jgi:carbon-monoxide dehydrogenase iron sulfur subunit